MAKGNVEVGVKVTEQGSKKASSEIDKLQKKIERLEKTQGKYLQDYGKGNTSKYRAKAFEERNKQIEDYRIQLESLKHSEASLSEQNTFKKEEVVYDKKKNKLDEINIKLEQQRQKLADIKEEYEKFVVGFYEKSFGKTGEDIEEIVNNANLLVKPFEKTKVFFQNKDFQSGLFEEKSLIEAVEYLKDQKTARQDILVEQQKYNLLQEQSKTLEKEIADEEIKKYVQAKYSQEQQITRERKLEALENKRALNEQKREKSKQAREHFANEKQFVKEREEAYNKAKGGASGLFKDAFGTSSKQLITDMAQGKSFTESFTTALSAFKAELGAVAPQVLVLVSALNLLKKGVKFFYEQTMKGNAKLIIETLKNGFKNLATYIKKSTKEFTKFVSGAKKGKSTLDKIEKSLHSIWHVFRYMVMRMIFRTAIKNFTTLFNKLVEFSDELNQKVSILYTALMKLNAAIVVSIAPIVKALAVPISYLADSLSYLLDVLAQFNAVLFLNADTYEKVNDFTLDYADSLDKAGKAASKNLAPFDQINKLGSGSGGSGTGIDSLDPDKIFAIGQVDEKIKNYVKKIKEAFKNGDMTEIGEDLNKSLTNAVNVGIEALNSPTTKKNISNAVNAFKTGLNGFFENPNDPNGLFARTGTLIGDGVQTAIEQGLSLVGPKGINTYNIGVAIMTTLQSALDQINPTDVGNFIGGLGNKLVEYLDGLITTWQPDKWASFIINVLSSAVNSFKEEDLARVLQQMLSKITTFISDLVSAWDDPQGTGESAANFVNSLIPDVSRLALSLVEMLNKALQAMTSFINNLDIDAIVDVIVAGIERLTESKNLEEMADAFIKLWEAIFEVRKEVLKAKLKLFFAVLWEALKEAISEGIVGKIVDAAKIFTSQGNPAFVIGTNILSSVVNAIKDKTKNKEVTEAVDEVSTNIKDEFCNSEKGLDIQHNGKSKAFYDYGEGIVNGLNEGLKATTIDTSFYDPLTNLADDSETLKNDLLTPWNDFSFDLENVFVGIGDMLKSKLELFIKMVNTTIKSIQTGLQDMVNSMNDVIADYNRAAEETGGHRISRVGNVRLSTIPVPKLATGAVLPPNKPFLAMLGDQNRGTNIEAPLDTIKQALAETMLEMNKNSNPSTIIVPLEVGEREFGRAVIELGNKELRRVGTKLITT